MNAEERLRKAEQKRQEAEQEIAKIKAEQQALNALSPEQKLAVTLHDSMCQHNHADQCGWHYEIQNGIHDFRGHSHIHWRQRAIKLKDRCEYEGVEVDSFLAIMGKF